MVLSTSLLILNFILYSVVKSGVILPQTLTLKYVEMALEEALKEDKGTGCDIPKIDPFSREVLNFDKNYPPFKCDAEGEDWVRCYLSSCKLNHNVVKNYKDIICTYKDIIYDNDFAYHFGPSIILMGNQEYKLNNSDQVEVNCQGFVNDTLVEWRNHLAGLRPLAVADPGQGRKKSYNVLILGFDSASKNGFIRKMPHSFDYIKYNFGATILDGYNIVGDATAAALIPILTGKTELELPECRKSIQNSKRTDSLPLIFYKLKEDGYRTAYFEDMPTVGTFQWRFNGFRHQPTDHYLRSFFLEETNHDLKHAPFCIGDTPQYQFMMNLTDQFFQLDGKKFAFTFIGDISHNDFNIISVADFPLINFLKGLKNRGVLRNTMVIIMGDHGPRYANIRKTFEGKLEERLPLMAIRLPDVLVKHRPKAKTALEHNSKVLTTPHDIYATVLDVIDMRHHWNPYKLYGADLKRGLTLLEPIPKTRSCSEAGIEAHWCTCLKWQEINNTDNIYTIVATELLNKINSMTEFLRPKCALRTLASILWVVKKSPNTKVLQFNEAGDDDGYTGDFSALPIYKIPHQVYQIKVVLRPGRAVFEATMTHFNTTKKFTINQISRINSYNNEPACLRGHYPHLYPYCYCVPENASFM